MTVAPTPMLFALLAVYVPHALALSVIDVREHRLPNRLVASMTLSVLLVLGLAAAVFPAARSAIGSALLVGVIVALLGITIALLGPSLLGMGDAKAAPAMVVVSAVLGWDVLVGALLGIALLGGVVGAVLMIRARDVRARFAYGPVLLAGPLLGLLLAPLVRSALGVA